LCVDFCCWIKAVFDVRGYSPKSLSLTSGWCSSLQKRSWWQ